MTDDPLDDLPDLLPEKREPTKLVGIDEHGNRVGEDHPRAKLTDHEVELIRQLHEEGGLSMREIAEKFEVAKSTIVAIVNYQRRVSYPTGWRRVKVVIAGHERVGGVSLVQRDILFHPGTKRKADNDGH
jgi:predicted DNA-binding protein (UPF0251 family)